MFSQKKFLLPASILILLATLGFIFRRQITYIFFSPRKSTVQTGVRAPSPTTNSTSTSTSPSPDSNQPNIQVIAEDLNIPWGLVFLPNGDLLVTERPGNLLRLTPQTQKIQTVQGVAHIGEGGLLGITLHPNFNSNNFLYLYFTTQTSASLENHLVRYTLQNNQLQNPTSILTGIPAAQYHDGGRIAFGPDGKLYVTTGDAGQPQLAQDTNTLNGKILRLNPDGSIPEDYPFDNYIYSYGHRNPQGLTWDKQGNLYSTEHGPSGSRSGFDELNLIQPGNNYGWPTIQGNQTQAGLQTPLIQSGATDTWAPADALFYQDSVFIPGLRGESLYQAKLENDQVSDFIAHFRQDYGRLRSITLGPDGFFYLTTSNTDGRGEPKQNDDKIIRINPKIFFNNN